ncbi:MAG: biopolymer transporter ExbD [Rikenellaceae bacterium]
MAIKRGSKVEKSFSSSSMTDLMFLLLLFLLMATTLISPNALRLTLPKSSNQLKDKAETTMSIAQSDRGYLYYVELEPVDGLSGAEAELRKILGDNKDATVSLHCDKGVAIDEVVQVMNMMSKNQYKLILATSAN